MSSKWRIIKGNDSKGWKKNDKLRKNSMVWVLESGGCAVIRWLDVFAREWSIALRLNLGSSVATRDSSCAVRPRPRGSTRCPLPLRRAGARTQRRGPLAGPPTSHGNLFQPAAAPLPLQRAVSLPTLVRVHARCHCLLRVCLLAHLFFLLPFFWPLPTADSFFLSSLFLPFFSSIHFCLRAPGCARGLRTIQRWNHAAGRRGRRCKVPRGRT